MGGGKSKSSRGGGGQSAGNAKGEISAPTTRATSTEAALSFRRDMLQRLEQDYDKVKASFKESDTPRTVIQNLERKYGELARTQNAATMRAATELDLVSKIGGLQSMEGSRIWQAKGMNYYNAKSAANSVLDSYKFNAKELKNIGTALSIGLTGNNKKKLQEEIVNQVLNRANTE